MVENSNCSVLVHIAGTLVGKWPIMIGLGHFQLLPEIKLNWRGASLSLPGPISPPSSPPTPPPPPPETVRSPWTACGLWPPSGSHENYNWLPTDVVYIVLQFLLKLHKNNSCGSKWPRQEWLLQDVCSSCLLPALHWSLHLRMKRVLP